jgi:hypothetical protein
VAGWWRAVRRLDAAPAEAMPMALERRAHHS